VLRARRLVGSQIYWRERDMTLDLAEVRAREKSRPRCAPI